MSLTFEICSKDNVERLLVFIDRSWRKDHIFVRNRKLFDWQHKNGESYNFVLAIDGPDIVGVLGFIPTSQFSPALLPNNEMWLAIWKVRDDIGKPGLGLLMLNFLRKKFNNPTICSIGLSQQVIPLYKALNYEVGILEHRAFFNQYKDISGPVTAPRGSVVKLTKGSIQFDSQVKRADLEACEALFHSKPQKDPEYIVKRYIEHPVYEYKLMLFKNAGAVVSIVVYRIVRIDYLLIARIVDVIGESVLDEKFNYPISQFLRQDNIDYIDIVSNLRCGESSGFIQNSDNLILPNYFEPLEMKNIEIDFAYKSNNESLSIFRGDSDQDRPSI